MRHLVNKLNKVLFWKFSADSKVQIMLRRCADIWVFAVLMGHSDSSHAAVLSFQQTAKSRSGCEDAQAHVDIHCYQVV